MAIVKPFKGVRPPKNLVEQIESRPYDVLNSEEARAGQAITRRAFIILLNLKSISNLVLLSTILAFMKALQRTSESSRRMAG